MRTIAGRTKARGFTLIELMVAMSILGLVMTLAVAEFTQAWKHYSKTTVDITGETQARAAMALVTQSLRQAAMPAGTAAISPVSSPDCIAAGGCTNPYPTAAPTTGLQFEMVDDPSITSADPNQLHYGNDVIGLNPAIPGVNGSDLIETVTDVSTGTVKIVRTLAKNVTVFTVAATSSGSYNVTIQVSPPHRADQLSAPFTLSSDVFISYFKPNK
ncbi:MAG TPA: prepilin-type N-terminal cleavage/methylation domain-containing protein [Candidatus Eremiobacteraceae bacterium]